MAKPQMGKTHKLLRKLLSRYREELVKKPFSKEKSSVVDCILIILESVR